jgi:fluoride exporter
VLERLAVIFAGGCVGGYARYAVTTAWSASRGAFPWSTLVVNLAGAFVLGIVVVVATQPRRHRHLRPLVGTGFCGALTTFSSVVVATDQLAAHQHLGTALAYVATTTVAGLFAAAAGLAAGRALGAGRW